MTTLKTGTRNWFSRGGGTYARFRPEYPPELARFLATLSPGQALAVDVGCGTGQLTTRLASRFGRVLGIDPSADQIVNATAHQSVTYACASAEQLPVADHSAQLVTAAQAAHWFDLPRFYEEVHRIAAPHAILALVSYGVLQLDQALNARFHRFYRDEIGPYWPAERKAVDTGYADLPFPFEECAAPPMAIRMTWSLEHLLGYISTWSAVRRLREAGCESTLRSFTDDLTAQWGDPARRRGVRWPIHLRVGALP